MSNRTYFDMGRSKPGQVDWHPIKDFPTSAEFAASFTLSERLHKLQNQQMRAIFRGHQFGKTAPRTETFHGIPIMRTDPITSCDANPPKIVTPARYDEVTDLVERPDGTWVEA